MVNDPDGSLRHMIGVYRAPRPGPKKPGPQMVQRLASDLGWADTITDSVELR